MFLAPYCPFYNPIEMFSVIVKRALRRVYSDNQVSHLGDKKLNSLVCNVVASFRRFPLSSYFAHCGYEMAGTFDWVKAYSRGIRTPEQYGLAKKRPNEKANEVHGIKRKRNQ